MNPNELLPAQPSSLRGVPLLSAHPPPAASAATTVAVGSLVTIRDVATNELEAYVLVPPSEANILSGRISTFSPMGRALFGRRVGDITAVEAPSGTVTVQVERIQSGE